jgi:hypothetical protein
VREGSSTTAPAAHAALSPWRTAVAVLAAAVGSVLVWVAVPYNNFRLKNSYLSDSFLPEIVVAFLLLLVLAVNPLLRLIGPRWMLNRRQLALTAGLLLFAAVIPSNGLMRMFPRLVAEAGRGFHGNVTTARIAADANFRQALFLDPLPQRAADGKVTAGETPRANQFLGEMEEGAAIPWSAWFAPMASWGMLILALWAMMVGLGGVVYPQWRDRERLPFPLLNVYQALVGDADDPPGRVLPGVFASRGFWIAAAVVFLIHSLNGLNTFTQAFPSFPLRWSLAEYYAGNVVMRNAAGSITGQVIFFSVVGVAYFIPSRYAISVWAWVFGYAWYVTLGNTYIPAFKADQIGNQTLGALLAMAAWVLWLGRAHWAQVGRAMLGRASGGPESRRDAVAGWTFAVGCAGIVCWLYWAGCSLWWSVLAMAGCALTALLMARLIAETGIPVMWLMRFGVGSLTALFPLTWLSPAILFFNEVFGALLTRATAVSAAVMTTLALGMDRKATPAHQRRLVVGGLVVLLVGFLVCGAVHVHMGYRHADISTASKVGVAAINQWDRPDRVAYKFFCADRLHQAVGVAIGGGLLWACALLPSWPIHPVGMLFCQFSIGNLIWFSVFLGWLIKVGITRLFGGGVYRKARPVFLGLILGELLAVLVWALVPVIIVWVTGADPATVRRYTIMQYP